MYSKKYRLTDIVRKNTRGSFPYGSIVGKVCYLGYFKIGERGQFLCDEMQGFEPVHRIHTSDIKDVKYEENGDVVVTTENTEYKFELIKE